VSKMDIASVSAETRKRLYDIMDPDRTIAGKVWEAKVLNEQEAFIATALGYIVSPMTKRLSEAERIIRLAGRATVGRMPNERLGPARLDAFDEFVREATKWLKAPWLKKPAKPPHYKVVRPKVS
jgi:hypothetical protein